MNTSGQISSDFSEILEVVLAHVDEPIPSDFIFPSHLQTPPENRSLRLLAKWRCRRMAYFLLAQCLAKYGLPMNLLAEMQKTPSGRPFFTDPHIDFNISHSGEWVAVIFRHSFAKRVVGIDLEHPQKVRRFRDLMLHYANSEEITELLETNRTPFANLADRFYLSWCLREAVLKSQGVGIVKLSEVRHLPSVREIYSAHCPTGNLHFYHQLPCYLCYFYETASEPTPQPSLFQWQAGNWQKIEQIQPLVYQVNGEKK